MHFQLDADTAAFRAGVRDHLREVMTSEFEERIYRSGVAHDEGFAKGLVDEGFFAPSWPTEFGGQSRDTWDEQVLREELMRVDAPMYLSETTRMVASIIRHIGTPAMQDRILDGAMKGDITIALGFTEPECGSDVAAATTKAVRAGDDWIINGSKMFTTNGHIAEYVFLLARTSPDKPKHQGLTMFLVPLDSHGFEAQAVWTLSGERTNITFYSDVRIGDEWRIGDVDGGWKVMGVALAFERGVMGGTAVGIPLLHHFHDWAAHELRDDGTPVIADPIVRERMVRVAIDNEVSMLLTLRAAWIAATGGLPGLEGSMAKIFATEA